MDPRSEVLLRQPDLFQGSVLLAGLPADDLLGRLPDAHGWCWHAGDQAALDARFAERSHFGVTAPEREFDTAALFTHQVQLATSQARGQGIEQVVGQVLGLGQEEHGAFEPSLRRIHPEMAALGKTCVERRLVAGMPAPAMGIGQPAQQVVGGQARQ